MIRIIGPKDKEVADVINTTSRSKNWSRGLSPFFVGPVKLYGGYEAKNVENAWQFGKVHPVHLDVDGNVLPEYFEWARKGWEDPVAHRYPMGRWARPAFSLWDGRKLGYIEARKTIYVPLYAEAVQKTDAFKRLEQVYKQNGQVTLWDFDGYDYLAMNKSLVDVINDQNRKMGHAFVLAMILGKQLDNCLNS